MYQSPTFCVTGIVFLFLGNLCISTIMSIWHILKLHLYIVWLEVLDRGKKQKFPIRYTDPWLVHCVDFEWERCEMLAGSDETDRQSARDETEGTPGFSIAVFIHILQVCHAQQKYHRQLSTVFNMARTFILPLSHYQNIATAEMQTIQQYPS